jgi:predicted nucleic acid-binding protein
LTLDRHLLAGRPHAGVEVLTPSEFLGRLDDARTT